MRLNRRHATPEDRSCLIPAMRFALRFDMCLDGFPYQDDLVGPEGIHLELMVPQDTSSETCERALRTGYRQRDVASHSVVMCPADWFEQAGARL